MSLPTIWNNLTALQTAAVVSALVLTIGAIVEYWYKLKLLALLVLKWILRKSTPFDRCAFRRLLFHSIGPVLVVLGIAGEVVFEGRTFVVEDRQEEQARKAVGTVTEQAERADETGKKAIADSTAAVSQANDALGKAGKAQESLGKAEDEANRAESAASNALTLSRGARQEADSFESDIKVATQQAADAESHLADALQRAAKAEADLYRIKTPRSLVRSEELIAALKPFSGTEYTLNVFMDDESIQFTKAVGGALEASGWIRKQPAGMSIGIPTIEIVFDQGGTQNVPACLDTGISLTAYAKESIETLKSRPVQLMPKTIQAALALKAAIALSISPSDERNVANGVLAPKPAEGIPMTICVGKKP